MRQCAPCGRYMRRVVSRNYSRVHASIYTNNIIFACARQSASCMAINIKRVVNTSPHTRVRVGSGACAHASKRVQATWTRPSGHRRPRACRERLSLCPVSRPRAAHAGTIADDQARVHEWRLVPGAEVSLDSRGHARGARARCSCELRPAADPPVLTRGGRIVLI